jgi:hypothetical protein
MITISAKIRASSKPGKTITPNESLPSIVVLKVLYSVTCNVKEKK